MTDRPATSVPTTASREPVEPFSVSFTLKLDDYVETLMWMHRRPDMQAGRTKRVLRDLSLTVPILTLAIVAAFWLMGSGWREAAPWVVMGGVFGGISGAFGMEGLLRGWRVRRGVAQQLRATRGVDTSDGDLRQQASVTVTPQGLESWTPSMEMRRPWHILLGLDEKTMKAAIVEQAGQTPVYGDFPAPVPAADEVTITVAAAALTPLTRARAAGTHYTSGGSYSFVAGFDGVGRLNDGTRVFFVMPRAPQGSMAEQVTVPNGQWLALPDDLDDLTAAAIGNAGVSSWGALTERAKLQAGETVLVNGATGASGRLAVAIARHLGASRVIATGRNQAMLDTLGADATIRLDGDGQAIQAAAAEHFAAGVDVVLDYLWGPSARALLMAAAACQRGAPVRFTQIGSVTGEEIALPAGILRSSRIELLGSGIGSLSLGQLMSSAAGMFAAATSAGLTLDHRVVPLTDVTETWRREGRERVVFQIG